MKKLVSLLLALVVLATCTAMAEVTYPISDEPIELTYWASMHPNARLYIESYEDNEAYQEIMKKTGVNIDFIHPAAGQEAVDFQLVLSDPATMPDIMASDFGGYEGGMMAAVEDGVLVDLTDYIPVYAPDYYALIKDDPDFYTVDGRLLAFYKTMNDQTEPAWQNILTRADYYAEYGKEVDTLAEFEDYMQWILDNKPGVIPFGNFMHSNYEDLLKGIFGIRRRWSLDDEGQVVYGPASPKLKDYLETMNRWYTKGYITKDYTTMVEGDFKAAFTSGKIAITFGPAGEFHNLAKAAGFEIECFPYIRKDEDTMYRFDTFYSNNLGDAAVITTACENIPAAVQFLNYAYTAEGSTLYNYGVEGLSWNYDEAGNKVYTDHMLKNEYGTEPSNYILRVHFAPKIWESDYKCNATIMSDPLIVALSTRKENDPMVDDGYRLPPVTLTAEENAECSDILTQVNTYNSEMEVKFISGEVSLDYFDEYLAEMEEMDIATAIEIYQTAYERYMANRK